ncbi:guanine deaminase [Cohnella nanjingensis]|uniref:Guanine deaminase n=1 Tax=Cohnella nanjingensis TaxID=1387779 RepID=A0A7X0VED8_9BACL|nr:guanine deaminase [Cohnella nanjingensis]MBB6669444.1 guanine deaminase [Cohnella nanjingensis]
MKNYARVFQGTAFTSLSPNEVAILEDHLFCINDDGMIEEVVAPGASDYEAIVQAYQDTEIFRRLAKGQYLLPGLVDLHVHAPQWAQSGTALDIPLYDWLNTYTFPLESRFADITFATAVYEEVVGTLLANGTTTALYFATIHREASLRLAEICAAKGQRGLVGKVVMDEPEQNPDYYRDADTASALADTERFILEVKRLAKSTKQGVYPVVTPRFIPSCTDEALRGLGELAAKHDTHIQSHCSESDWAHGYVRDRYGKHDAFALHDFGLLGDKSVMAHCNFLDDNDADLFAKTGTAISHCPLSNAYFANSVIPIARWHAKGIEIGLGSDLSGGFSPSLFDNARQAVISSRMLEDGVNHAVPAAERGVPNSRITIDEAFYLATAGGGESLSLPIGRLAEEFAWDALIVDVSVPGAKLPLFHEDESLYDIFQKIMYLIRPEHIREVWVQGENVHARR